MNAIFNIKRFTKLVSLFVVFAMFANLASPAFAETKPVDPKDDRFITGWTVVKAALAGGLGGWAVGALMANPGVILAIGSLGLPVIPILVGAVALGGLFYAFKKIEDGARAKAAADAARLKEAGSDGSLLGTPMLDNATGTR
jgi:hypothetical protein